MTFSRETEQQIRDLFADLESKLAASEATVRAQADEIATLKDRLAERDEQMASIWKGGTADPIAAGGTGVIRT